MFWIKIFIQIWAWIKLSTLRVISGKVMLHSLSNCFYLLSSQSLLGLYQYTLFFNLLFCKILSKKFSKLINVNPLELNIALQYFFLDNNCFPVSFDVWVQWYSIHWMYHPLIIQLIYIIHFIYFFIVFLKCMEHFFSNRTLSKNLYIHLSIYNTLQPLT